MSGGGALSLGVVHLNVSPFAWARIFVSKVRRRWRQSRGMPVVAQRITPRALRRAGRTVDDLRPRVVLYDTIFAVPVKSAVTHDAPAWVITCDLMHKRSSSLPDNHPDRKSLDRDEEIRRLEVMDVIVAIQAEEAREFRQMVPHRTVLTLPMPIPSRVPRETIRYRGPIAVFVGARSEYNATGLRWFLKEVWPTVRQRLPEAQLDVCGDVGAIIGPPPAGVRIHGRVPALEPFYESAALTIAPLLAGSGLKIKIVEGFAFGLPCVATSLAARGIPAGKAPSMLIADDPRAFAEGVVTLMSDPDIRRRLSDGATDVSRQLAPPGVFQEWDAVMGGIECPLP